MTTAAHDSFTPSGAVSAPAPATPAEAVPPKRISRRLWIALGAVTIAVVGIVVVYVLLTRGKESTDDAQVQADVVPLAPRVGGTVLRVLVQDNQHVESGQLVLQLDDADYGARAEQAEAELAAAQAALVRAGPEAAHEARDLARSEQLRAGEVIAEQQLEAARVAERSGRAGLLQARANVDAAHASLVLAKLQLSYTKIAAPAAGRVSDLQAHPGQILEADQPFAQFVPDRSYVVANFKETQTGRMRPGQRASVSLDAYPHRVLEGRVESLSAGTGAQFSLLPASNATGNFVKVVQRVPVRIALVDPPAGLELRVGLSANVTVYLR